MPATDGPSKRKKTGNDLTTCSDMTTSIGSTPKEHAKAVLSSYLASLPKAISLIGASLSKRHFDLQLAIDLKHSQIDNLDKTCDKFPRSLNFKFTLKGSDAIKNSQEFKTLAAEAESNVQYFRRLLKQSCQSAVKLELAHQQSNMKSFFCEAIYLLATAFAKNHHSLANSQVTYATLIRCALCKELAYLQGEASKDNFATQDTDMGDPPVQLLLLTYSGFPSEVSSTKDLTDFFALLVTTNSLDLDKDNLLDVPTNEEFALYESLTNEFRKAATVVFFTGYKSYALATEKRLQDRELIAWAESTIDARATQETATIVSIANLSSPALGDLIASKVAERTKKLTLEQDRLKRQLQQLKVQSAPRKGGRQKNSPNKSKNTQNRTKNTPNKSKNTPNKSKGKNARGQKAAAAGKDSTAVKPTKATQRRPRNSNGN